MSADAGYGIAPSALARLRAVFETTPGLEAVRIFGSRARGDARPESDIDLAYDAPDWSFADHAELAGRIEELGLLYRVDGVWLQGRLDDKFRSRIQRDGKPLWTPRRHSAEVQALGGIEMKDFQTRVLEQLGRYLDELKRHAPRAAAAVGALRVTEGREDLKREAGDFPKEAWAALKRAGALPAAFASQPYSSRFDGAGRAIPNVCLKVPTGGGKTLLAAASVARVFSAYLNRHAGLVLWVVPNEAIYRQTLKSLADRDHPYRQILNVAGAGRVKLLEKQSPLSRLDVESHLCVMLLMLQSAARQSRETLRFFRDRGDVLGFLPREDDIDAHWELLGRERNLDAYSPYGSSAEEARAQKGSIVKSSLGNVMRLLRPMVVIDEGHHAYSETALRTLDGFNPSFMLELSATPRVASAKGAGSNILVDVRGSDLDDAEMIKLPIHVDVKRWDSWQSCLGDALRQLDELQREADALRAETARYIRPILLVQVERTGAELRDAGLIHAEDAKAHLLQLGLSERQIAIKTSEKNDLAQPENIDLLSPACEVRAIVTKAALQEGWDCPFAYVLCALAGTRALGAMTQLVGRILRLPHVAKTGRDALDACYVQCFDADTREVVAAIKKSLEGEGMGDLAVSVRSGDSAAAGSQPIRLARRPQFAGLKIYLPTVSWAEPGEPRRELVYESDVLAHVAWAELDTRALADGWGPNQERFGGDRLTIDLSILAGGGAREEGGAVGALRRLDRARLVRALLDLAPNAWHVWGWVDAVVGRLLAAGYAEAALAASSASLAERLRADLERERDRLAQAVFERLVHEGRIEFRLRADRTDYALPETLTLESASRPPPLQRPDYCGVEKSLLAPALRTSDMNSFEAAVAGYLDQKAALHWWHRNVAKTQYGLQGWKRNKVYPDFVFALASSEGRQRMVALETKGLYLSGSPDTAYKQALLKRLTEAFSDARFERIGSLELQSAADRVELRCDLVFDPSWEGTLEGRYFSAG